MTDATISAFIAACMRADTLPEALEDLTDDQLDEVIDAATGIRAARAEAAAPPAEPESVVRRVNIKSRYRDLNSRGNGSETFRLTIQRGSHRSADHLVWIDVLDRHRHRRRQRQRKDRLGRQGSGTLARSRRHQARRQPLQAHPRDRWCA